ncbi:MAG: type I-U CRISPR-associated protein Csb2, partial [Deltaproteobacteria bacterium]|nr:type I-U CRISPR-associated protein Csb2 [Deltaproteobacteria bacterium]
MFGLGIRYLVGWAMAAADGANKKRAEWPPHPDRVFMALAAAWFETGQDTAEGEALRWIEGLEKLPDIAAPEASFREVVTCYVPVNDSELAGERKRKTVFADPKPSLQSLKKAGLTVAVEFRQKKERSFPIAIPHVSEPREIPKVHLVWKDNVPEKHRGPLAALCRKVISIGHSASLVQMWLDDSPPAPTLVAREGVTRHRLRVFGPRRLDDHLAEKCDRSKHIAIADALWAREQISSGSQKNRLKKEREGKLKGIVEQLRPNPWGYAGYDVPMSEPVEHTASSHFDPRLLVLTLSGKRLSLPSTLRLTETLRGALMVGTPQPVPEWLSGHTPAGSPSEKPHLAFLPLPFVGREHADGRLMGVALVLPRTATPAEAERVMVWLRNENGSVRRHRLLDGRGV